MRSGNHGRRLRGPLGRAALYTIGGVTAAVALPGLTFAASAIATAHSADPVALAAGDVAKLYIEGQAEKGKQVYSQNCASCHGDHEQGASAPAIAGTSFMKKAQLLGWSVDNLRHIVVTTMPRSNPGSLSAQEYADVLAYLLATDCLPAGNSAFPTKTTPELKNTPLQKPAGSKPDDQSLGTCKLHASG